MNSFIRAPRATKPLVVADPKEILTFNRVCISPVQVNHGHSVNTSLLLATRHLWAGAAIARRWNVIDASPIVYRAGYNHKTGWPYLCDRVFSPSFFSQHTTAPVYIHNTFIPSVHTSLLLARPPISFTPRFLRPHDHEQDTDAIPPKSKRSDVR
jgi:hypothetical protein